MIESPVEYDKFQQASNRLVKWAQNLLDGRIFFNLGNQCFEPIDASEAGLACANVWIDYPFGPGQGKYDL